jgi:CheY-like chemotaxis protein
VPPKARRPLSTRKAIREPVTNPQPPFDAAEFERLVRDALANLHDQAALATHPFAALVVAGPPKGGQAATRSDLLRRVLLNAIERLRPAAETDRKPGSPEWRPYQLLHGRYVEGLSLQQLQAQLSLSERQLRREHSRALEAVARHLQDTLFPGVAAAPADDSVPAGYPVSAAALDLLDLLGGVIETLRRRAESEGARLDMTLPSSRLRVLSDRVVLRQVLLSLFNYALDIRSEGMVRIALEADSGRVLVRTDFQVDDTAPFEEQRALDLACFWCEQIDAVLLDGLERPAPGRGRLTLSLPSADQPLLLVVDDQESALRLYQRYLAHTGLKVTGERDGAEVLGLAKRLQPQAIMLDVMMPNMDGWEVLQGLKADPLTRRIPVIVCSVWEEPELASSLGATGFLAKPIKQADLLAALERLKLL